MAMYGTAPTGQPWTFYHIPKTGGTSVNRTLRNHGAVWTLTPAGTLGGGFALHAPEPPDPKAYVFACVRHPVAYLRSYWSARQRLKPIQRHYLDAEPTLFPEYYREPYHLLACLDSYLDLHFPQFIEKVTTELPGIVGKIFKAYSNKGTPWDRINYLGRTESLEQDLYNILTHLGYLKAGEKIHLAHANAAPLNFKDQAVYTPELKKMVLEAEAETIRQFY